MRLCSITNSSIWKQFKALLSCNNTHGIVHARDGWRTDASCVDSIVKRRINCETKFQCNWLKLNAHCTLCIKCCAYNYPMSLRFNLIHTYVHDVCAPIKFSHANYMELFSIVLDRSQCWCGCPGNLLLICKLQHFIYVSFEWNEELILETIIINKPCIVCCIDVSSLIFIRKMKKRATVANNRWFLFIMFYQQMFTYIVLVRACMWFQLIWIMEVIHSTYSQ